VVEANRFLRERYISEFNRKFSVPAAEKGTAFQRSHQLDLNCVFSITAERVVAKDNTVAIGNRVWQIDKTRFRHTLAGCTVMVHEHLDGTISIRYGPHVVGRFDSKEKEGSGGKVPKRRGKDAPITASAQRAKAKTKPKAPA
jgi:hypothetical protein